MNLPHHRKYRHGVSSNFPVFFKTQCVGCRLDNVSKWRFKGEQTGLWHYLCNECAPTKKMAHDFANKFSPPAVVIQPPTHIKKTLMTPVRWEILKWVGNAALLFGTLVMISPLVASTAITPWALFLLGNLIWLTDSIHIRSWPWVYIAGFLATWDTLIIISRLTGTQFFGILDPIISIINVLP